MEQSGVVPDSGTGGILNKNEMQQKFNYRKRFSSGFMHSSVMIGN